MSRFWTDKRRKTTAFWAVKNTIFALDEHPLNDRGAVALMWRFGAEDRCGFFRSAVLILRVIVRAKNA